MIELLKDVGVIAAIIGGMFALVMKLYDTWVNRKKNAAEAGKIEAETDSVKTSITGSLEQQLQRAIETNDLLRDTVNRLARENQILGRRMTNLEMRFDELQKDNIKREAELQCLRNENAELKSQIEDMESRFDLLRQFVRNLLPKLDPAGIQHDPLPEGVLDTHPKFKAVK